MFEYSNDNLSRLGKILPHTRKFDMLVFQLAFSHTPIHIRDVFTPYSSIPMVYPSGGVKLSSDWPPELCSTVYRYSHMRTLSKLAGYIS